VAPPVDITLADITTHLDQVGLARFKWPERLVQFDALPMTETGKVKKFELVQVIMA
jgi:non-ribosomal peptide synthetase component E (peptide arylation enzyme)